MLPVLLLFSCKQEPRIIQRSFYYWKTNFEFGDEDRRYIDSLHVERLYIRFFDVQPYYSGEPAPQATIQWKSVPPSKVEVVPCIYIVNKAILSLPSDEIPLLAANIEAKIDRLSKKIPNRIPEVQIDCDWTESTRANYFQLLELLKKYFNEKGIKVSATIRLHQVKYAGRTGVPPIDRGMLMFYNTGKIQNKETKNSILELETAKQYIGNLDKYPLPLDVAYPVFTWSVWFRNDSIQGIMNYNFSENLSKWYVPDIWQEEAPGRYRCAENNLLRGDYFLKNDEVRVERIDSELCREAAKLVATKLSGDSLTVSLYHWDETYLNDYGTDNVSSVYDAAR